MFERILSLIKGLSFFVVGWGIVAIGWSFVGACSSSIVSVVVWNFRNSALCTMAAEDEILFIESVDGVDGPLACEDVTTNSSDMESVL